jgi:hypothetical protein
LADDAVMIGPVSVPNSLLTGKLTGNFVDSSLLLRFWRPVGEQIQCLAAKFPTQWNRELFRRSSECSTGNREFRLAKSKSSPDEVFGTHRRTNSKTNLIPKKQRCQVSVPWAGERSRMPWRADADCRQPARDNGSRRTMRRGRRTPSRDVGRCKKGLQFCAP